MSSKAYSESAKMEQIITEFFAKSLHIILESRCPYVSSRNYSGDQGIPGPSPSSSPLSTSSCKPRDKWFNLALRDCPAALENIDFWRQSNLEPMIVDVILVHKSHCWDPLLASPKRGFSQNSYGCDNDELCDPKNVKIIERWVLEYESKKSSGNVYGGSSGFKRSSSLSSQTFYKKSILLLRSLYATVRLLPAYRLFRDLVSSAKIRFYNLCHRISSFVEPFTRGEESDMRRFVFAPLETACGRLCLSVSYNSSVLDANSEPSTPISPQFIPEYVGSPLAEPLRRFPSLPTTISPSRPSPFHRRHSWGFDLYSASSPFTNPSSSPSQKQICDRYPLPPFPSASSSPLTPPCDKLYSTPSSSRTNPPSPSKRLSPSGLHEPNSTIDKFMKSTKDEKLVLKQPLRSTSRLPSVNKYDESAFYGAFIVDDDDLMNPDTRSISMQGRAEPLVKKSQDAAVGALVQMLNKAPPLSKDTASSSTPQLQSLDNCLQKNATSKVYESPTMQQSSNPSPGKTTADALHELLEYSRMKEQLLEQHKSSES